MDNRERWGSRLAFIMAAVGSAVGLGNVWRFPFVAFKNGGGAFFMPYLVALLTAGIPVMMLEYALGMKYQAGAPKALGNISKRFKWVGWFAVLVALSITFYYCAIMAYSWRYMIASVGRDWEQPTSNQTVFKCPYILVENEEEKKQVKKKILDAKNKIAEGKEVDGVFSDNRLYSRVVTKKGLDEYKTRMLEMWGDTTVLFDCCSEFMAYVDGYFNEGYKTRFKDITPRVMFAPYEEIDKCDSAMTGYYDAKIEAIKTGEDKTEEIKIDPERKARFILFKENMGVYFNEVALGGFEAGKWTAEGEKNHAIDAAVKELESEGTDPERLDEEFISSLSVRAGELVKEVSDNPSDTAKKTELIGLLESYKVDNTSEIYSFDYTLIFWGFVTWGIIFLIIFKGVNVVGKVVMITVPLPIIILGILIIHGLSLEGAGNGINFLLTPNWDMVKDPGVWMAAYGQVFFSLSLGFGILIAYASYMPRESDVSNNAFMTSFCNCATSFYASFAIFSILGYLAMALNSPVSDVVAGGPGLVFAVYPVALSEMSPLAGSLVGIGFFLSLLALGIDSAFSIVEAVITGVHDYLANVSKTMLTAIICGIGFLVTVFPYSLKSGLMWLDINDNWMNNYGLVFVGLMECIAVGYFYRIEDLRDFINERSEIKIGVWWDAFIKVVTPGILIYLIMTQLIGDAEKAYGNYDQIASQAVNLWGWGYFALLFLVAFLLGRNFMGIVAFAGIAMFTFLMWAAGVNLGGAVTSGIAFTLLFGGFAACLRLALAKKDDVPPGAA